MPLDPKMTEHFARSAKVYHKQGQKGRTLTLNHFKVALNQSLIQPPITSASIVHDNAAGPGTVTKELITRAIASGLPLPQIIATDISGPRIDVLKETISSEGWTNARAEVMDGKHLKGIESDSLTHSITNFGIYDCGAEETYRTLRPGGLAVITTWKTQPWIILVNQVRQTLHPGLPAFPLGYDEEWWTGEYLKGMMEDGGFRGVKVHMLSFEDSAADVEEMLGEVTGGFWDVARDGLTDEERARWDDVLRQKLDERGSLRFVFEAWCGVATK